MSERHLGRQIGKYRVIRLLGSGSFSWVYEAIDQDLEIPVALKILRPEFAGQEAAEARFRREAATAARLRHPNIVTVRDVGQIDGASFVAMDLQPLSLALRLAAVSRLPETEVVRLGMDVASALAIAHAGGVIHRDIKPDNVLIGAAGEAVVADFGMARALVPDASVSSSQQLMGTPHYFSPEQARGADLDGRSDLYSLGVMLFRSLSGRLPFEGEDWYVVARQHVDSAPPLLSSLVPDVSPDFEAVVNRLLAKNPDDRFDSAIQLVDALATLPTAPLNRGHVLNAHSSSPTMVYFQTTTEMRAESRKRITKRMAAIASIAVIAILVWFGLQSKPSGDGRLAAVASPDTAQAASSSGGAFSPGSRDSGAQKQLAVTPMDPAKKDSGANSPVAGSPSTSELPRKPVGNADAARARTLPPPRVSLALSAPDSAVLFVDGQKVGIGEWVGDHAAPATIKLSAVIAYPDQVDCKSARKDTTLKVAAGDSVAVNIFTRACVGIQLNIKPAEARVVFTPVDGGTHVDTRADLEPIIVVTTGKYFVQAISPRCQVFSDTMIVKRQANGAPIPLTATLPCGMVPPPVKARRQAGDPRH